MPENILIAAYSGRALATAARRVGIVPLVADLFGDADTRELAGAYRLVNGDLTNGFCAEHLVKCLEHLAAMSDPLGIVYGAGFEANPGLLREIAKRWRLIGNGPDVVQRLKEPTDFARTCAQLAVRHPAIMNTMPSSGRWLRKSAGGAGGAHIVPVSSSSTWVDKNAYFQEEIHGNAISALFVAAESGAIVIGFSEQWLAPCLEAPFRFGGAVRPARLSHEQETALSHIVYLMAHEYGLVGLNSADFLVNDDGYWLLEINPRPGATLDIFDSADHPLLAIHIAAVLNGTLPNAPDLDGAAATQIVYASRALSVPNDLRFPSWTLDRPRPGCVLTEGEPFCTVLAKGKTACEAKSSCASYERHWRAVLKG